MLEEEDWILFSKKPRSGGSSMKINDPRIIIVDGSKFERARIIQGSLIYLILGAFSVGAILHNESWGGNNSRYHSLSLYL